MSKNKIKSIQISRSVPQMITSHLPGNIKSFDGLFYKMDKLIVKNGDDSLKEVIYLEFLKSIFEWLSKVDTTYSNLSADGFIQMSKLTDSDKVIFNNDIKHNNFHELRKFSFFSDRMWKINEIVNNQDELDEYEVKSKIKNYASYFPHSWKCNNCSKVLISKFKPNVSCICKNNSWKQLSVALVSSSNLADVCSIGKSLKKNHAGYLTCIICKGYLKLIESQSISQYRLVCEKNKVHQNKIEEPGLTLYSLYSGSIYHTHMGEFVNFNQDTYYEDKEIEIMNTLINSKKIIPNERLLEKFSYNFKYKEKERFSLLSTIKEIIDEDKSGAAKIFAEKKQNEIFSENGFNNLLNFYHSRIESKGFSLSHTDLKGKLFDFEKVGLVDNIEVVSYSYGYTRISDKPITTQTGNVKMKFFYNKDNFVSNYAKDENYRQIFFNKESNQGLYFKLNTITLDTFINSKVKYDKSSQYYKGEISTLKYKYLHSLCHYLIRLISQSFSGISTSSLTEIIFPEQNAFLIYKKGSGKELGYLESFYTNCIMKNGERFDEFWDDVNNINNLYCPADEICEGACIECLIISKHSCKHENKNLDRNVLM